VTLKVIKIEDIRKREVSPRVIEIEKDKARENKKHFRKIIDDIHKNYYSSPDRSEKKFLNKKFEDVSKSASEVVENAKNAALKEFFQSYFDFLLIKYEELNKAEEGKVIGKYKDGPDEREIIIKNFKLYQKEGEEINRDSEIEEILSNIYHQPKNLENIKKVEKIIEEYENKGKVSDVGEIIQTPIEEGSFSFSEKSAENKRRAATDFGTSDLSDRSGQTSISNHGRAFTESDGEKLEIRPDFLNELAKSYNKVKAEREKIEKRGRELQEKHGLEDIAKKTFDYEEEEDDGKEKYAAILAQMPAAERTLNNFSELKNESEEAKA
jgi:hypothetical protein